ncbi:MAG: DUF4124 domain-containing protein [Steroidobacteraceae bacterium]
MNSRLVFIAATIATALVFTGTAGAAESSGAGRSYRWVDSHGVVHYGDSVPPEYASQGRSELNPQGVPLRELPRQLSTAEAAAAQLAAADVAKRRQHDSFLLATYAQVRDIEQLRDERVALIEGQQDIVRGSINSADQRIVTLQDRMRNFQPYSNIPNARRMPDQLVEEVVRALKERRGLQEGLASRELEKNQLRTQFDADIARYRELTSRAVTR